MVACHVCMYRKASVPRPGTQRCADCTKALCRVHKRKHDGKVLCPDCIYAVRRRIDAEIQRKAFG